MQYARRERLAITGALVAAATGALVALYARAIAGLAREWTSSPDASHGLILLVIACAIAWHRRVQFVQAADGRARSNAGLVLLLAGLTIYLVGLLGADIFSDADLVNRRPERHRVVPRRARAARLMAVPLVFLLMAIPLPSLLVNSVTLPLQFVASHIAESVLTLASGTPCFATGIC